jgi:predicted nucleotidyltransferase
MVPWRKGMHSVASFNEVRDIALPILRRHGISKAGIFGSCARGEISADSDIDMLVEIRQDISLLEFIRIKQDVEEALGRNVDLVEYDALKPLLRDRILSEQVSIL